MTSLRRPARNRVLWLDLATQSLEDATQRREVGRMVARPHGLSPRAWLASVRQRHLNAAIARHLEDWLDMNDVTWNGILPTPGGHVYADCWDLAPGDAQLLADACPGFGDWPNREVLLAEDSSSARRALFYGWWRAATGDPSSLPLVADGTASRHELHYPRYGWLWRSRGVLLVGTPAGAYVAHASLMMERRGRLRPELAAVATGVWARGEARRP